MSIQRIKARSLDLVFKAVFINIDNGDNSYSPWINSDEERIMQIVLGL